MGLEICDLISRVEHTDDHDLKLINSKTWCTYKVEYNDDKHVDTGSSNRGDNVGILCDHMFGFCDGTGVILRVTTLVQ